MSHNIEYYRCADICTSVVVFSMLFLKVFQMTILTEYGYNR